MNRMWFGMSVMAFLLVTCTPALAAGFDFAAGPSVTSSERVTSAASASMSGDSPADGRLHFEPVVTLAWVGARTTRADDLHHQVFLGAGGVRMVTANGHWFASEQLATTSTRTDALSSRFEFMTSAGWQDGHFLAMLRHVSNAKLLGGGKNLGETMLLAGIRW
jgi:hypothetical protein